MYIDVHILGIFKLYTSLFLRAAMYASPFAEWATLAK